VHFYILLLDQLEEVIQLVLGMLHFDAVKAQLFRVWYVVVLLCREIIDVELLSVAAVFCGVLGSRLCFLLAKGRLNRVVQVLCWLGWRNYSPISNQQLLPLEDLSLNLLLILFKLPILSFFGILVEFEVLQAWQLLDLPRLLFIVELNYRFLELQSDLSLLLIAHRLGQGLFEAEEVQVSQLVSLGLD
jgi:hypothetical protein